MLDWIIYGPPWWVWLGVGLVLYALGLYVASAVFGWQRVRPFALPILFVIGAVAALHRQRQAGWDDKVKEDLKAADRLIERARKTRAKHEAEVAADPKKLREPDEFMRDD